MRAIALGIARFSELTGRAVSWLTLIMVVITFAIVVLRYLFDLGWIWLQESVTWMHAAVFMLGAAYTLGENEHVRVDVFYRRMSPRRQALVGVFGGLTFLLPMCLYLFWVSIEYVTVSWDIRESSREAGGLPYPFVPLMKSLIPVTALLLAAQGLADLGRDIATLAGRSWPRRERDVPPGEVL